EAEQRRLADEQAALRRVATLVAADPQPEQVFQAVTEEVCRLLGIREAVLERFEDENTAAVVARYGDRAATGFEVGTVIPLEEGFTAWQVRSTGQPARVDSYDDLRGEVAERVRTLGFRATVGV